MKRTFIKKMLSLFLSSAFLLNLTGGLVAFAEIEPNITDTSRTSSPKPIDMTGTSSALEQTNTLGETTRGWDGPSETFDGIYIDGLDPYLAALTATLVGIGVQSGAVGTLVGHVFSCLPAGSTTVHGRLDRYYEEVSIGGEFAYWRTTYTLYLYDDEDNRPLPDNPYTAVYEGSQLWSIEHPVNES